MLNNSDSKSSIIIPCRNEEKYIGTCINSIISSIPNDVVEIIVVDGDSTDKTSAIVQKLSSEFPIIKLMQNPSRTVPSAMNIAIKECKGNFILRLDAHTDYPPDYIQNCVSAMYETNAECVGGIVITIQNGNSLSAKIVQMLTTHWFGVGNSSFRLNPKPHYADTVPFGFFKKSIFSRIGYFDERLTRNQDYEFNQRIIKTGGKVWLDPKIKVNYKNQPTVMGLLKQAFGTGKWNVWMWRVAPYSFKLRHAIPGFFAMGLIGLILLSFFFSPLWFVLLYLLGFYFLLSLFASIQQSLRYKVLFPFFILPFGFFLYHLSYGLGIITGILLLITGKSEVCRDTRPWLGASDFFAIKSILYQ
ncbi:MAG: glycosyltransferase family 2 protein [Candidatus Cloacimonetes bacterium]|nr:glycosyltransferase family 2 protein [Candidatus Cloacimonadota bacterium]